MSQLPAPPVPTYRTICDTPLPAVHSNVTLDEVNGDPGAGVVS